MIPKAIDLFATLALASFLAGVIPVRNDEDREAKLVGLALLVAVLGWIWTNRVDLRLWVIVIVPLALLFRVARCGFRPRPLRRQGRPR